MEQEKVLIVSKKSLAVTHISTLVTHTLNVNAKMLEFDNDTEGEKLVVKWGSDVLTSTNYDAIIPASPQIRHLVIPDYTKVFQLAKKSDLSAPTMCTVIELPEY